MCNIMPSSTQCFLQVDVRTIHGSTPLCNACAAGSLECAKLLLSYGANVNPSLTALTASPLHEACIRGELSAKWNQQKQIQTWYTPSLITHFLVVLRKCWSSEVDHSQRCPIGGLRCSLWSTSSHCFCKRTRGLCQRAAYCRSNCVMKYDFVAWVGLWGIFNQWISRSGVANVVLVATWYSSLQWPWVKTFNFIQNIFSHCWESMIMIIVFS